jgi:hypothetical protein
MDHAAAPSAAITLWCSVRSRARWTIRGAGAALAALGVTLGALWLTGVGRPVPGASGTAVAEQDTTWNNRFQAYGNLSGAWSGGDGAQSLALPDGSTMWFFSDTFLGPVGPGSTRSPFVTGLAHNSAVLYRGGSLGPTNAGAPGLGGYNSAADYTWVAPPPPYPADRYELINGDQVIDHDTVYKFYQLADRGIHPGGFQYKLVGTVIETFSLDPATDTLTPAGGTPLGVADSAQSDPVIWGAATLVWGGYVYVYGVKPYNGDAAPYPLYLARVPVGGLATGDAWRYYDGTPGCSPPSSAWVSDPRSATALRTGVSAGFSVTDVDGTLVLLTSDTSSAVTANDAVAYYADCPTGFSADSPWYWVYRPRLPDGYLAYEYRIVPQFSHGSHVLVSYSLDITLPAGNLGNVAVYRPHFLDVRLPAIRGHSRAVTAPPP